MNLIGFGLKWGVSEKCQGILTSPGTFRLSLPHLFLLVVVMLCVGCPGAVHAQEDEDLIIQAPNTDDFPVITIRFKLKPAIEDYRSGLNPDQIHLFEDEQEVDVRSLDQEWIGVHFTLAINGGSELDLCDSNGESNYVKIKTAISRWALERTTAPNDVWSLVTNEGIIVRNLASIDEWVSAFDRCQTNFRSMEPDLNSLESALVLVKNRVVPFGVDKVLLYITPPPKPEHIERIGMLGQEARAAGIRVNVWMVGDPYFLTNDQGNALLEIAANTGGQFFNFSGTEMIPDPESYLESLGMLNELTFQSGIRKTGTYPLKLEIVLPSQTISGTVNPFYIEVSPPHPILLSPPKEITRSFASNDELDEDALYPDLFNLNFMVEFPDHFGREIAASRLFVDGRLADERTTPPFDTLTWDYSSLTETGEHTIQIEVEDQLGLIGKTILTPIQLTVVQPEAIPVLSGKQVGFIFAGILSLVAFFMLIRWAFRRYSQHRIIVYSERFDFDNEMITPSTVSEGKDVQAVLIPLNEKAQQSPTSIRQIIFDGMAKESVFITEEGAVDTSGIDEIRTQLFYDDNSFWVKDQGSRCGIWVNYTQIGTEPVKLQTGDLIHFGDMGFRFRAMNQKQPVTVTIDRYEPLL